jgi:hypothetical protein
LLLPDFVLAGWLLLLISNSHKSNVKLFFEQSYFKQKTYCSNVCTHGHHAESQSFFKSLNIFLTFLSFWAKIFELENKTDINSPRWNTALLDWGLNLILKFSFDHLFNLVAFKKNRSPTIFLSSKCFISLSP